MISNRTDARKADVNLLNVSSVKLKNGAHAEFNNLKYFKNCLLTFTVSWLVTWMKRRWRVRECLKQPLIVILHENIHTMGVVT